VVSNKRQLIGLKRITSRRNQWLVSSPVSQPLLAGVWATQEPSCKVSYLAILEGSGDAPSKIKALRDAGIVVSESAGLIGKHMLE
jgi:succinyl-CoA synthetase alpha subunit